MVIFLVKAHQVDKCAPVSLKSCGGQKVIAPPIVYIRIVIGRETEWKVFFNLSQKWVSWTHVVMQRSDSISREGRTVRKQLSETNTSSTEIKPTEHSSRRMPSATSYNADRPCNATNHDLLCVLRTYPISNNLAHWTNQWFSRDCTCYCFLQHMLGRMKILFGHLIFLLLFTLVCILVFSSTENKMDKMFSIRAPQCTPV
jgi:hypothetical protein